jgi:ribosomal protein S18 acetylase RimI-like enzyme
MTINYKISPPVTDRELNQLFHSVWEDHKDTSYKNVLSRSLLYVCAYNDNLLIGYVNLAWDGDEHGFILDTTVNKKYQRKGIGTSLVLEAIRESKKHNLK